MKRAVLFTTVLLTVCLISTDLLANIDNLSNMSVEWMRTANRNAATDRADIVVYNPGGITELPDGVAINIGNQSMRREPEHSYNAGMGEKSFEQDGDDPFLPNIYAAYNRNDWALWGGFYIPGGGAVVDYPTGSFTTNVLIPGSIASGVADVIGGGLTGNDVFATLSTSGESLEAESMYLTFTLGGTYKFNDMVSVALGGRYIDADNSIEGTVSVASSNGLFDTVIAGGGFSDNKVDVDESAEGAGYIVGININPTDRVNIGIQYQSRVDLDFKADVNQDNLGLYVDGAENPRDFPAMLGFGVGWDILKRFYLEANYSYWFQEDADWGKDSGGKDISDMAGDTQSYGITGTCKWTEGFSTSVGTVYTDFLWNDIDGYYSANIGSYEVLYSDNWQVCGGVSWQITKRVEVNAAVARTIWDDETITDQTTGVKLETENATTTVAIGANFTF
ncbi:OmpP1/FadL family transporter [Desulfoluna spongiiphila]|uniref:Long-chain fatty acid transport protein n=1 Tax=Desulfoluna spongiiphila TaxID=419481 RepID=A0A1G5H4E1_9BACT|nr:outer membrane protein transport protein [Desulfoluna spongiiphila]SCY58220.1 long-chain fatty acid transport protein [Desulfoluna spongiiphila]